MFFNKSKKKNGYVIAKTPEARKKKMATANYYAKKRNDSNKDNGGNKVNKA